MELIFQAAKWTYLLIGFSFLPLAFYFFYRVIKDIKKGSRTKKHKEKTIEIDNAGETLKPLNCNNCGGILSSGETIGKCQSCGSANDLPEHYKTIMQSRRHYERLMKRALVYQKKYEFMTNPVFDKALLFLALWIIGSLFIIALMPSTVRSYCFPFVKSYQLLDILPTTFTLFSLISVGILFLLRINFDKKTRAKIPVKTFDEVLIAREETIGCQNCAAPVHFAKHEAGHICLYCGAESFRVNFAFKAAGKQQEISQSGRVSLINVMKEVEKSADDFMAILGLTSIGVVIILAGVVLYNLFN